MEGKGREGGRLVYVLLYDLQALHQDSCEFLDEVWPVARLLQLDDDGFDNVVVDGVQVDLPRGFLVVGFDRRAVGGWRGRWCVLHRVVAALRLGCRPGGFVVVVVVGMRSF